LFVLEKSLFPLFLFKNIKECSTDNKESLANLYKLNRTWYKEFNQDLLIETQSKAVETCRLKCINTEYKDGTLSKAESVCTDRCITKFFEATKYIEELAIQILVVNQQ
jgi:hypothetical protein